MNRNFRITLKTGSKVRLVDSDLQSFDCSFGITERGLWAPRMIRVTGVQLDDDRVAMTVLVGIGDNETKLYAVEAHR